MAWLTRTKTAASTEDPEDAKAVDELIAEAAVEAGEDAPASSRADRRRVKPWKQAVAFVRRKKSERAEKAPRDAAQWTAGGAFATKVATGALAVALAAGPVSLAWNVFGGSEAPVQQASGGFDQRMMNRQGAATDVALQFVPAWLGASEEASTTLESWWPDTSDLELPDKGSFVTNVSVLRASAEAPGLWNVVVGADVVGPDENAPTRRYYQVPIAVAGDSQVAAKPTALPALVPRPSRTVPDVSMSYPQQVPASAPVTTAAQGFFSAMLTGSGDVRLYERPGVWIPPIKPAPADRVEVAKVQASGNSAPTAVDRKRPRDGQVANLLVTVNSFTATSGDEGAERVTTSQYVLRQVARAGRWEVTAITASPVLKDPPKKTATSPASSK